MVPTLSFSPRVQSILSVRLDPPNVPPVKLLLFGVAALLATGVYYLLVTATEASLLVVVALVILVGVGVPQLVLYLLQQNGKRPD